jgi:hypothetical protein
MENIKVIQDRIRQAAIELQPRLRNRLSAKESRAMLKARKGGEMLVPDGINLIERRPYLLANGRTPADVREVQSTLRDLVMLMQVLGPLAGQVADSIRQYRTELYRTVLGVYATASRVQGDAEVALFAKKMRKQLASGPRSPRMVRTVIVNSPATTVKVPPPAGR